MVKNYLTKFKACTDKAVSRTAQTKLSDFLQEGNAVLYYCIAGKYNCQ